MNVPRGLLTTHPAGWRMSRTTERRRMAIAPVQLIVPGFDQPEFEGKVLAEQGNLTEE